MPDTVVKIEPVNPETSVFGSAPDWFWKHANFAKAFENHGLARDGVCYLSVPCHDSGKRRPKRKCDRCRRYGLESTVHRLYFRRSEHAGVVSVRLAHRGKGKWEWVVTKLRHRTPKGNR